MNWRHAVSTWILLSLSGCASVNFDYPKTESYTLAAGPDSYLSKRVADLFQGGPGESGFLELDDGVDALAARYVLSARAEKSIDAMYFVIKADAAGSLFIMSLLEAADRGVRVRVLVDDAHLGSYTRGVAALDGHPNVEIRIFNPFARSLPRWWNAVTDFRRINRRMHNKAFIVDGQVGIVGGRNVASEYFGARPDVVFVDSDFGCVGPVVDELTDMFDSYWNHRTAVPVAALVKEPDDHAEELEGVRNRLSSTQQQLSDGPFAKVLTNAVIDRVETADDEFIWTPYELLYDNPDKALKKRPEELEPLITPELFSAADRIEKELLIISPYFVPRKAGLEMLRNLRARDVRVIVVTNSLASTNQVLVHSGYAPVRKKLLNVGVELYEINPTAEELAQSRDDLSSGKGTLHGKVFVADRQRLFVGTFNFDPRSAYINTEMGVIIENPPLAEDWTTDVLAALPANAYRLSLTDKGALRWNGTEDGEEVTRKREPETGFWKRFGVNILKILPIKDQL
ncbi:MAG: phospholipase D family protein [Gammaproteobacteria bacterium]